MILRVYFVLFCLFISLQGWCFEVKDNLGQLDITISRAWKYQAKFLNLTHFFEDEKKNTLSFTFTGLETKNLNSKLLEKNQEDYFKEKLNWAKARSIKITSRIPYQTFGSNPEVHMIGTRLLHQEASLVDYSFYFICSQSLIHVKALVTEASSAELLSMIKSIKCK